MFLLSDELLEAEVGRVQRSSRSNIKKWLGVITKVTSSFLSPSRKSPNSLSSVPKGKQRRRWWRRRDRHDCGLRGIVDGGSRGCLSDDLLTEISHQVQESATHGDDNSVWVHRCQGQAHDAVHGSVKTHGAYSGYGFALCCVASWKTAGIQLKTERRTLHTFDTDKRPQTTRAGLVSEPTYCKRYNYPWRLK